MAEQSAVLQLDPSAPDIEISAAGSTEPEVPPQRWYQNSSEERLRAAWNNYHLNFDSSGSITRNDFYSGNQIERFYKDFDHASFASIRWSDLPKCIFGSDTVDDACIGMQDAFKARVTTFMGNNVKAYPAVIAEITRDGDYVVLAGIHPMIAASVEKRGFRALVVRVWMHNAPFCNTVADACLIM